jgi:D-sedoheptulose 7-phosphate isomerase
MMQVDIERSIKAHQQAIESVLSSKQQIEEFTQSMIRCLEKGGKIIWCGNGGSAAEAQHMAAELMVRYRLNRQPLASLSLTSDTSVLTSHINDYDFESVFARQVEAIAKPEDMVVGMSTSGKSLNVINALKQANDKGCVSVVLVGRERTEICKQVDLSIQINSEETARIQEAHTFINHLVCEGLDNHFK